MTSLVALYVTYPDEEGAKEAARRLVAQKVVACANITPCTASIYEWRGEITEAKEVVVIYKMPELAMQEAMKRIKEDHPYDVPCIVAYHSIISDLDYGQWVEWVMSDKKEQQ